MENVKLVACEEGHRSHMPADAIETANASTYSCPVCGRGVTRHNFETIPEKRGSIYSRPFWG